jgi:imidazolonepropionase-like amidohydrolase
MPTFKRSIFCALAAACLATAVADTRQNIPGLTVLMNARVITAAGPNGFQPVDAAITIRDGKVASVGPLPGGKPPAGARVVDLGGQFVTPGLIVAHAHVSDVHGLKPRAYTDENTRRQLGVYARYGITSVVSLGGEQAPAFKLRDEHAPADRARIFVSGDVITGRTPEEARAAVARVAALEPDIIKIRVDDNLGSTTKMAPEVYRAVIEEAHKRGLPVAAHIFYLDDAKALLKEGVDMIAHSVRDKDLDDETIALLKARNVPYCPTLTREVSVFAYEATPAFFSDPFFLREADPDVMAQLQQPARQQAMAASTSAQRYKAGLVVAMRNLKKAADAGVLIAMGTDSGPAPERFQGYFEHLEMQMMAEAGLTPAQILKSATTDAVRILKRKDLGQIVAGSLADLAVFRRNPLADIRDTQSLTSVWISGQAVRSPAVATAGGR